MNFSILCDFLDNLRMAKRISEKAKLTKAFLKTAKNEQEDLFSIIRLLIPRLDRDRPSYKIRETKISKLLIKMLGLPQGSDKNLLLKAVSGSSIDFGDIVYTILKKYIVKKETDMTVANINNYLDKIANRNSDNGLDDLVLEMFRKLSPKNTKWLVQIILKDMKLGISDNTILNCFHEDGANFYSTNNNLRKLCEVLSNPWVKLHELDIHIFEPFRPMLSKRCDATNFKKCFPDFKPFIIENKFDGERFQLHMEDGNFKYFSRNGFDYTNSFGASYDKGTLTPFLNNVFDLETKRIILDGEMMLWNTETQKFGSKGIELDVKKLSTGKYRPCFCVFDVLLHNDKVLTNQPLLKRLNLLKTIVKNPVLGTIMISEYKEGNSREDIVNALNFSVDRNEEGIVVKDPKSIYKCSDRNSGWFKIKMEYFDDVVHDLDVIMMGGCYGAGNKINSFFVGVSSGNDTYFSFGRISSGLTDEQLDMLNDLLKNHGIDYKQFSTKSEGKLFFGRETPDVYVEPQNSCILQIRATELIRTTSDNVKCPYTLRFPRVLGIRDDKPVDDCLSMNELLELTGRNKAVIKLNKRHIELSEIIPKTKSKKIKLEIVNLEQTREESNFLRGKRFYVHSGTEKWSIEDIYYCIKRGGGEVSYRLESNVDIVLVSKINSKITNLMKQQNNFDIVHTNWLRRVLDQSKLVSYNQNEMFKCGASFNRDLATTLDKFGDSFMEETTKESLVNILELMKQTDEFLNINEAVTVDSKYTVFLGYVAYFDSFEEINNPESKQIYYSFPDEMHFEYYKGVVSKKITSKVNLIIIRENNEGRERQLRDFLIRRGYGTNKIVTKEFIYRSSLNSNLYFEA